MQLNKGKDNKRSLKEKSLIIIANPNKTLARIITKKAPPTLSKKKTLAIKIIKIKTKTTNKRRLKIQKIIIGGKETTTIRTRKNV